MTVWVVTVRHELGPVAKLILSPASEKLKRLKNAPVVSNILIY